jgi:hypothetical protein
MTDHVPARHAETSNYKSADFLANSAAIIRSKRVFGNERWQLLAPRPERDGPLRVGFFLRTLPIQLSESEQYRHRGGVRIRSLS